MSAEEILDAFYNAVVGSNNKIQSVDFVMRSTTNKPFSYDQTKMLVLQIESVRIQVNGHSTTMATNVKVNTTAPKCSNCDDVGHIGRNCPHTETGLRVCFECKHLPRHIIAQCPQRLSKGGRQNFDRRYEDGVFNNRNKSESRGAERKNERQNENKAKTHRQNNFESQSSNNRQDQSKSNKESDEYLKLELENRKRKLESGESHALNVTSIERKKTKNVLLAEFLADMGATEHLRNSRLIFKTFKIDKLSYLENVIWAENLSDNLLSLRKFVDQGLNIYLDNKKVDIYDPVSNELFMSDIYKRPYWLIELKVNDKNSEKDQLNGKIVAYITTRRMKNEINTESVKENEKSDGSKISIELKNNKSDANSDFENTMLNGKLNDISEIEKTDRKENHDKSTESKNEPSTISKAMLWHARMGHASLNYLRALQRKYPDIEDLDETVFDDAILDCEVCIISRINRLPFKETHLRATEPLQIVHSDTMGMISPVTYPKKYKYISVFVDDNSRLAMAYPMNTKDETALCFESFVKSARNLLGKDSKVCYLRSDQRPEFTGSEMSKVLNNLGAELQLTCPNTPQQNEVAKRFIQTIQKKVRTLINDSGFPENMWDLALGAAVYAYNRTPHASLDMQIPIQVFKPEYKTDLTQIKRFGCIAYMKIYRKTGTKVKSTGKRMILVGYKATGYILFSPEVGGLYESRDVRFNEKLVFADKYKTKELEHWEKVETEINSDTWFTEFEE